MKKILWALPFVFFFCSCSIFKAKYGCPTNGKNIGAERVLSGDKETMKALRKAKKFKA
jgi:hypothetical protein